jgi:antitoxin VapB
MADTTTVFQSGNSQAVRLPKEFRFKSKTVEIFRRGNEVVLREKPLTLGDFLASLPPITPEESEEIRLMFADVRDTRPAEEREWFKPEIDKGETPKPKLKSKLSAAKAGSSVAAPTTRQKSSK